ncbi:hypothetical protein BDQ12DRAFT_490822 [Crucibulum laeve]|uniref:SH3 domain-containing protein n=1 Tax=Crucibulum laeve TaxID=68775 RepID=A0A5C3M6L1_9AGAR|nr:hypothetical protein BDQ12DRAFT_490822 [Crucibulum laeve]
MPAIHLLRRDDSDSSPLNPIYIAGFAVVGAIVLGVAIWLALRFHRKRAAAKREETRGAAFLSVRGLVKEGEKDENEHSPSLSPNAVNAFSRNQINPGIVLPDKVLTRQTRDEIMNFHRQSGTFPKPFSFALSAGSPSPRASTLEPGSAMDRSSMFRNSFMSGSSFSRFSVMSTNSSVDSNPTTGTTRKVRQLFSPVLPDELLLTRTGEQLTVVQSFDDGWCVVGRESATIVHTAKSLFKPAGEESNVELGVVPAWCFLKPVKGLRAERPVRSTSLGITVQMDAPGYSSRNELVSWSNF